MTTGKHDRTTYWGGGGALNAVVWCRYVSILTYLL